MKVRGAIITIKHITLAMVLVDPESTYPAAGAAILRCAELVFPTLPIILLTPRVGGFSRNYATFELNHLINDINADTIIWQDHTPPIHDDEAPF